MASKLTDLERKERYKQSQKRYRLSEKGRAAARKALQKYRRSTHGAVKCRTGEKKWRERNPDKYHSMPSRNKVNLAAAVKRMRIKRRKLLISIKQKLGCQNPKCPCLFELPLYCLEFHHVDNKTWPIGELLSRKMDDLLKELAKCTVLCVICHRMITHGTLILRDVPKINVSDIMNPTILARRHK